MRRKVAAALAGVALVMLGYAGFRYVSRQFLIADADRTAARLSEIREKIAFEDLSSYFAGAGGSFVLFDEREHRWVIFDEAESQKRVSPCSTFKIVNSLIGLETGAVEDENTLFKWDGTRYQIPSWNQDQTLASAFSHSAVWYYQKLASKIGPTQMQHFLNQIPYGNANISGGLTKFWLDSSLRISPVEQVLFLRRFYAYDLPFAPQNIDTVKRIMVLSKGNGSVLSGKTGSAGEHLAWFVGYVQTEENTFFFATMVKGKGIESGRARKVTEAILRDKKVLR